MDKFPVKTSPVPVQNTPQPPPKNTPKITKETDTPELIPGKSAHLHNRPGKTRPYDWVCSIRPLPGADITPAKIAVPDAIFWLDGDGLIKHIELLEPDDEIEQIKESFATAINSTHGGAAGPPKTIRTDTAEVVNLIKPLYPTIDYVLGEVPEILGVAQHLSAHLENQSDRVLTYKDLDIPLNAVASYFQSAASLYRKHPWKKIASPQNLIGISIDAMGIQDHVISIMGQEGSTHGAMMFESVSDYLWFCFISCCADPTRFRELPPQWALHYINGTSLHPIQRKEIMEQGWPVANTSAYPEYFHTRDTQVALQPTTEDLALLDAAARGLTQLLDDTEQLKQCWQSMDHWRVSKEVSLSSGKVDVVFQVPALPTGKNPDNLNPLEQMAVIDHTDPKDATIHHGRLIEKIATEFQQSPEFTSLGISGTMTPILMDFAFNYTGLTIASVPPMGLEDILYEYIPRKVMVDPSEADEIVDDFFAFYQFLKRAYQFSLADECLSVLNKRAKRELSISLSDPEKFGMAKTLFSDDHTAPESWHLLQDTCPRCLQQKTTRSKIKAANYRKNRKKKRKSSRKARKRSS